MNNLKILTDKELKALEPKSDGDLFPYMHNILDMLAPDSGVEKIVIRKGRQPKTEWRMKGRNER